MNYMNLNVGFCKVVFFFSMALLSDSAGLFENHWFHLSMEVTQICFGFALLPQPISCGTLSASQQLNQKQFCFSFVHIFRCFMLST